MGHAEAHMQEWAMQKHTRPALHSTTKQLVTSLP